MKRPEFCPNFLCKLHRKDNMKKEWFRWHGKYMTKTFGKVQRFLCTSCKRTFSIQTFSIDYYAKKKINYRELLKKLISTSNQRDISRDFKVSLGTVRNKIFRLSRQALAMHQEMKHYIKDRTDVVADGFESYCVSQYYPNNIHLLALKESQYVYYTNYVTIRRKGRMTDAQKQKREKMEAQFWAPHKGIEDEFSELLDEVADISRKSSPRPMILYTDEKHEYARAINKHKVINSLIRQGCFIHNKIPSKKARTFTNQLFTVNYLDRQMRKDLADHVRETVCFSRNVNDCMERLAVYFMYHNYMKLFREKQRHKDQSTHAEVAGIHKNLIRKALRSIFTRRRFLSLENISGFVLRLWQRQLFTPLKCRVEYVPQYALAR
jgi:transposase-like protein